MVINRSGKRVPKGKKAAARWYRKAVEKRNEFAQSALGDMYREGQGVPQDDEKAPQTPGKN